MTEGSTSPKARAEIETTQPMSDEIKKTSSEDLDLLDADKMIGEFRILRRLGKGGMAEVYLAEQTTLKRRVAVKVLRPDPLADASYVQRFRTEALAAAGINHPNIVQVYTVGEVGGVNYIAQEYVQGQNLREFLVRKGPPTLPVALHIMKQVAAALQVANAAGIVHRDIKPENIMLTRKGEVKVADFGLAKVNTATEPVNLTKVGITMGTPLYMSPEQVNGAKLDQRSDIYSFGVTCYHMLSGSPPFRGDTALSVAIQHLREEPPPLDKARPDLPPLLCKIVHKMMAKDMEKRYPSGSAVLKDLKRVSQETKNGGPGDLEPTEFSSDMETLELSITKIHPLLKFADTPPKKQVPMFVVACIVCGLLAAGLGWVMRPANPLEAHAQTPREPEIPRKSSAADQFEYARGQGQSEEAWEAVISNFPNDTFYKPQAELQLALNYLRDEQYDMADQYFKDLRAYSDWEPQWRVAGLSGQAILLSLRNDPAQSQKIFVQLAVQKHLLDDRLRPLILEALERNRKQLGTPADDALMRSFER